MGHPYDALELMLDHIELMFLQPEKLPKRAADFLKKAGELFPETRCGLLAKMNLARQAKVVDRAEPEELLTWLPLSEEQAAAIGRFCSLEPGIAAPDDAIQALPSRILTDMRAAPYPNPPDFQQILIDHAAFFFLEGARLVSALLRSIYMVDRTDRDLEARDAFRLMGFLGALPERRSQFQLPLEYPSDDSVDHGQL